MAVNPYLPGLEPINTMNNPVWNPITNEFEYNMGNRAENLPLPGMENMPSGYPWSMQGEGASPNSWMTDKRYVSVPEGMRETISDAVYDTERRSGVLPGGRELPARFRDPQQHYMENRPKYDVYDSGHRGPIASTGLQDEGEGYIKYDEDYRNPYSWEARFEDENAPYKIDNWEHNPMLQQALIKQKQANLYRDQGITGLDVQETISPDEDTITAEEQIMTRPDFGRITPISEGIREPNFLQRIGQKLGMTQVSPQDRRANKQFMGQQGIGRDPTTGRMIGGDFAGKNAPGTSAWGSANFGEMAQKWDEEYGDMVYRTQKMRDKQARMKQQAAAYAQKVAAEKTRQEALRDAGAYSSQVQLDPGGGGTWHQQTAAKEAAGEQVAGPGFGKGAYFYQGGRVGYKTGGRVGILSVF